MRKKLKKVKNVKTKNKKKKNMNTYIFSMTSLQYKEAFILTHDVILYINTCSKTQITHLVIVYVAKKY